MENISSSRNEEKDQILERDSGLLYGGGVYSSRELELNLMSFGSVTVQSIWNQRLNGFTFSLQLMKFCGQSILTAVFDHSLYPAF